MGKYFSQKIFVRGQEEDEFEQNSHEVTVH